MVHFRSRSTGPCSMHTVVANLSSQSSYRLRPTPVSRGAFRHEYLSLRICSYWGSLMRSVAQIARLSAGLCRWYAHQTLTPTVRKIRRIPLNPRRRAQGAMNGAQRLDTRLAAHGKRAAIVFRPPFPCEVRTMKLGRYQGAVARDLRMLLFSRGSSFEKAQQVRWVSNDDVRQQNRFIDRLFDLTA